MPEDNAMGIFILPLVTLTMTSSKSAACFYCSEYAKVVKDYPMNSPSNDLETFTPRCNLHWRFECSTCGDMTHFNGIAWCSDCKTFTCLGCAEERMVRKEFLVYDYYYEIPCDTCGSYHAALDYAENCGIHPFQNGDLQPEGNISVWKPILQDEIESQDFPHQAWGSERILSLGQPLQFKRLESLDEYNPKSIWDGLAASWLTVDEENYHHKYRILPDVYRMLDVQKNDKILDVACGKGDVARHLARSGAKVTGIDISKMLDYAVEKEEEEKLGIEYIQLNAENLFDRFGSVTFDKVVCNMALMDIEDYKTTIHQISLVLKDHGIFVFSITHPAYSYPSARSIRIPVDSQRNEDRIRIVLDYFDERPTVFSYGSKPPMSLPWLAFQRPISSYLNELVKNNLILRELIEPKVSEELVQRYPRNAYWDDERRPEFLIVKTMKHSVP